MKDIALAAAAAVSIDLETTGLGDDARVLQVGAFRINGAHILRFSPFSTLVKPGIEIPPETTAIHGLTEKMIEARGFDFSAVAPPLVSFLSKRVWIGYSVAFDARVLRRAFAAVGVLLPPIVALDIQPLGRRLGIEAARDLDEFAAFFGLKIARRHNALDDALAAAEIYQKLLPLLAGIGVVTVGDALAACRAAGGASIIEPPALTAKIADDSAAREDPLKTAVRHDPYLFRFRVADAMTAPAKTIDGRETARAAAQKMGAAGVGYFVVEDRADSDSDSDLDSDLPRAAGVLSERDILRALADGREDALVADLMSANPRLIGRDERLFSALAKMTRHEIRHLPVESEAGGIVGVLSMRGLLWGRLSNMLSGLREIESEAAAGLGECLRATPAWAEELRAAGVAARDAAAMISARVTAVCARAAELARDETARQKGPAPARFCVLILGSVAREECLLASDQDNALIYETPPGCAAEKKAQIEEWFAAFAARACDLLDEAGLVYCPGGVMMKNREWRGDADFWRAKIGKWRAAAAPQDALCADIFFDARPIFGDLALGRRLRADALQAGFESSALRKASTLSLVEHRPQLNWRGGLRVEGGRFDIKSAMLFPITAIARLIALKSGIEARSTPARLAEGLPQLRGDKREWAGVIEYFYAAQEVLLAQQIADCRRGDAPTSKVEIAPLSRAREKQLRETAKTVAALSALAPQLLW